MKSDKTGYLETRICLLLSLGSPLVVLWKAELGLQVAAGIRGHSLASLKSIYAFILAYFHSVGFELIVLSLLSNCSPTEL